MLINYPPIRTLERKHYLSNREMKPDTLTVFKLIAKKYPEINATDNLPTLFEPSSFASKFQRLSSYDNVESAYAASFINSSHSDDGTLFSEPWDSSQWDSFLPNTDGEFYYQFLAYFDVMWIDDKSNFLECLFKFVYLISQ